MADYNTLMKYLLILGAIILFIAFHPLSACGEGHFHDLTSAAQHLYTLEDAAFQAGTYPVAGLLLDKSGNVIFEQRNRVISSLSSGAKYLLNPTNHGERQIISWYYQNKDKLSLPPPSELTIVTTLDPCLMCGSSIVASGFNVGTISFDDFAGVNFKNNGFQEFSFAADYKQKLLEHFGYYKVNDNPARTQYEYGATNVLFKDEALQKDLQEKILKLFTDNVVSVREQVGSGSPKPADLLNLKNLPSDNKVVQGLKTVYADALTIALTEKVVVNGAETIYFEPNQALKDLLTNLVASTPQATNALALIDPHGNLLVAAADTFQQSPISSAILNTVTAYAEFHFNIIDSSIVVSPSDPDGFRSSDAYKYLPSLADCTFVFLNALPGDDKISLQTVGIYGSSAESEVPQGGFLYINGYADGAVHLEDVIKYLPTLYTDASINISPMQAKIGQVAKPGDQDETDDESGEEL